MLESMASRETFWNAASRSSATKTRVVVRLGKVLDEIDPLVGAVFATNTMLHGNTQRGHCLFSGCDD